jgi:hypothetical protein
MQKKVTSRVENLGFFIYLCKTKYNRMKEKVIRHVIKHKYSWMGLGFLILGCVFQSLMFLTAFFICMLIDTMK